MAYLGENIKKLGFGLMRLPLLDANDAASYVEELVGEDANIIFGAVIDENLNDEIRVTVIATGFEKKPAPAKQAYPSYPSNNGGAQPQRPAEAEKTGIFNRFGSKSAEGSNEIPPWLRH